jgi:uncharacterized protein
LLPFFYYGDIVVEFMMYRPSWPILVGVPLLLIIAGLVAWQRGFFPNIILPLIRCLTRKKNPYLRAVNSGLIQNLVKAGNLYFQKAFAATPFRKRLLFLPFCLRPKECPAGLNPDQGYTCPDFCPECELGKVQQEALALGYDGVYVVPSSRIARCEEIVPSDQFMLGKMKQHQPGAVLGVVCQWYVHHRLISKYSIGRKGFEAGSDRPPSVIQGVLLKDMNCRQAEVDWGQLRKRLNLRSNGQ